jgi:DNA polymerase
MFIGEAPGKWEDLKGRPFIGMAGREFDGLYLKECMGVERQDVYVTNARKCRPAGNRTPTVNEIRTCGREWLPGELQTVGPEVVVLMGASACKLVEERVVDLEAEHGMPFWGKLYDWEGWCVPTLHPARGLHESRWMRALIQDFEQLGEFVRSKSKLDYDTLSHGSQPVVRELLAGYEVDDVVYKLYDSELVGIDTETHNGQPWSVQFAVSGSAGYMVKAGDKKGLEFLGRFLQSRNLVFHHAPADLGVCRELGLPVHEGLYEDTMQMAYQLGLPQGLKTLAYRVLGVKMRGYEDLVLGASRQVVLGWLATVLGGLEDSSKVVEYVTPKKGLKRQKTVTKPHALAGDVTRIFRHTLKVQRGEGGETEYDPWQAWERVRDKKFRRVEKVEEQFGRMPKAGIGHVVESEAVKYGCDDARVLVELWRELDRMQREVRVEVRV